MQTLDKERVAVRVIKQYARKTIMVSPSIHRVLKGLWYQTGVRRIEDVLILLLIAVEKQAEREKKEVHEYLRDFIKQVPLEEG